jgi:diguanylate cyclase (GGDEF)-like protein
MSPKGQSRRRRRAAALGEVLRRRLLGRSRSLVTEILTVQLAVTALIGVGAIAGLAWTASVLIQNNLTHWATQWATELNELGAPFYLHDEAAAFVNVERFVAKYPEIARVTWYRPDGSVLAALADNGARGTAQSLATEEVDELAALVGRESSFLLTEEPAGPRRFRISGPIWTESIVGDGLFDFDPASVETAAEILGFVSVRLDFTPYRNDFLPRLLVASVVLLVLLGATWAGGRVLLKRALKPLAELQTPLAELAAGDRDIAFPHVRHAEMRNIVRALEDTTRALHEREGRLLHLANHDPLTGLHNRHRLMAELEEALGLARHDNTRSALLFIDLDQFKYVNDTCGHPAGDYILKLAAEQIRAAVRAGDFLARFGGDEFVALLKNVGRREACEVAEVILGRMRSLSYVEEDRIIHIQCSIGISMIQSGRFAAHEVIAQADIACQAAKSSGRNRREIYKISAKHSERMVTDMGWARNIRTALEQDEFTLLYQPIMHVKSGLIEHYEALLRLRTEGGQLIGPDTFLPAAVRFGLMADIDRWVVERALGALARFRGEGAELSLAVNVSRFAFESAELVAQVRRLLRELDLPGPAVIFEITEQMAVRLALRTDKQMAALRELGCRFALDDFGTGYSSFSYLKRLEVDYLKIDGSFIRRLARDRVDQSMVRMIAEVARTAGMKTVAEYVQSEAALRLLAQYGIDYAQGYYIGRPAPTPLGAAPETTRRAAAASMGEA